MLVRVASECYLSVFLITSAVLLEGCGTTEPNVIERNGKEATHEELHIAEKCLTRKSQSSKYYSYDQDCCAATTNTAACLDGYEVYWPGKCCAGSLKCNSTQFYCVPTVVDDNGPGETGMPGTEHRRRWKYNAEQPGKTGTCCQFYCGDCEEHHTIEKGVAECDFLENYICASRHR